MKELEKNTYIFSVEAIGFAKTLEKKEELKDKAGILKNLAGNTYKKFADARQAEETKSFANFLRESYKNACEAKKLLEEIHIDGNSELENQQEGLIKKIKIIVSGMDDITKKLIY